MLTNRANVQVSAQISFMAELNVASANFTLDNPFQIKNDGDEAIALEVNLWSMPEGVYIQTNFDPGWNPEIIRSVKAKAGAANLKYGY